MIVSWLLFLPIVGLLSLGCGLLAERLGSRRLPGVLLMPLGLAVMVVVTQLATHWDRTAELAVPAVVAIAVLGLVTGGRRLAGARIDPFAAAAAACVIGVFAAPVVLSGEATFAGYNLNGEPSIHFIGIDRLMDHGRSLDGVAPSSYEYCLQAFFGNGYPSGAQTALGSVRPISGTDVAWVYQPFLVYLALMTALCLYALVSPLVSNRFARAAVVFVAAQPALSYAYALQGSLKEMATAWVVALLVVLATEFLGAPARARSVVPLAVATAASLGVVNIAIAPWLGLVLLACVLLALRARGLSSLRALGRQVATFLVLVGVLAYPALSVAGTLYDTANDQLTAQDDLTAARGLGNLAAPLKTAQAFGIWLQGDYRFEPTGTRHDVTYALIWLAVASAMIGVGWAARRRALGPLLYLAVSVVAGAYVVRRGSPWADAKALMIASPAVLLAAAVGPVALLESGRGRIRALSALVVAGAVALGVLWSNALAYHDVNLAPRDRLEALSDAGDQIAGEGPTVYFEFEEYGKHFLRNGDPEGRTEACERRFLPLRNGQYPLYGFTSDLDEQTERYLLYFRTIVLRRSPAISRPPSTYTRTYSNSYYEVWQRPARPRRRVVTHMPVGDLLHPSARPRCSEVRRLGRIAARVGGEIAYVPRAEVAVLVPTKAIFPRPWTPDPSAGHVLIPNGPGGIQDSLRLGAGGSYTLWLGGSFGRGLTVAVDGETVGKVEYALNGRDQYERVRRLRLTRGKHIITLKRGGGDLRPGNGGLIRSIGPVVLEPDSAQRRTVRYIDPGDARSLCGRELDWAEVVSSPS